MRIIAGKYRGRRLKSPPSLQTRPTSDRLRETLFNVLASRIEGASFLDLCAGTGAVGIEALSRSAKHVALVDRTEKMGALIESNLSVLSIEASEYDIATVDAFDFLRKRKTTDTAFNLVFFDPPYSSNYECVLNFIGEHTKRLLQDDAVVIIEHAKQKEISDEFGALKRYRLLKQGDSVLSFYRAEA